MPICSFYTKTWAYNILTHKKHLELLGIKNKKQGYLCALQARTAVPEKLGHRMWMKDAADGLTRRTCGMMLVPTGAVNLFGRVPSNNWILFLTAASLLSHCQISLSQYKLKRGALILTRARSRSHALMHASCSASKVLIRYLQYFIRKQDFVSVMKINLLSVMITHFVAACSF